MSSFIGEQSTDFRPHSIIRQEDEFVSRLYRSLRLKEFAVKILFETIKKLKKIGVSLEFITKSLSESIIQFSNGKKILTKSGFDCSTNVDLCNGLIANENFEEFKDMLSGNSLSQITAAMYLFTTNHIVFQHLMESDDTLKANITTKIKMYYSLPDSFSYENMKVIYNRSPMSFWLFPKAFYSMDSSKSSLLHSNLLDDANFFRSRDFSLRYNADDPYEKYDVLDCQELPRFKQQEFRGYCANSFHRNNKVALATSNMKVSKDTFWMNLMKTYHKQVISGPSSSCIQLYAFVFQTAKIIETPTVDDEIDLLFLCIADYYFLSHSISEILQTYIAETESLSASSYGNYSLDKNDLSYIKGICRAAGYSDTDSLFPTTQHMVGGGKSRKWRRCRKKCKRSCSRRSRRRN